MARLYENQSNISIGIVVVAKKQRFCSKALQILHKQRSCAGLVQRAEEVGAHYRRIDASMLMHG
ncbi:hypothetical protein AB4090_11985 [Acidithiobacillus sp. IBUN Pt1247-S3]|uniref:hypothetical protein n=1 Tax=Acidithiobacillus sp. IBUN Pt1247-S3 TaxID=3166642 RepID=UPI0034E5244A